MEISEYERDTRAMLQDFKKDVQGAIKELDADIKEIRKLVTNELMHRYPAWITLFVSLMTGIIGALLSAVLR